MIHLLVNTKVNQQTNQLVILIIFKQNAKRFADCSFASFCVWMTDEDSASSESKQYRKLHYTHDEGLRGEIKILPELSFVLFFSHLFICYLSSLLAPATLPLSPWTTCNTVSVCKQSDVSIVLFDMLAVSLMTSCWRCRDSLCKPLWWLHLLKKNWYKTKIDDPHLKVFKNVPVEALSWLKWPDLILLHTQTVNYSGKLRIRHIFPPDSCRPPLTLSALSQRRECELDVWPLSVSCILLWSRCRSFIGFHSFGSYVVDPTEDWRLFSAAAGSAAEIRWTVLCSDRKKNGRVINLYFTV